MFNNSILTKRYSLQSGLIEYLCLNNINFWLSCLVGPLVYLLPKTLKLSGFLIFWETCHAHYIRYLCFYLGVRVRVMLFNATFNNISVISWRSVLLVEKNRVPRENHRPSTSHWQTLSHNNVSSTPLMTWIRTHNISGHRHWLDR